MNRNYHSKKRLPEWQEPKWFEDSYSRDNLYLDRWGTNIRASQSYRMDLSLNLIREIILRKKAQKILDVGCGLGFFAERMYSLNRSNSIHCCDRVEHAITEVKKKYPQFSAQVDTLPDVSYASNMFDIVVALEVIYYLDELDREVAISQIHRVLKTNGYFFISGGVNRGDNYFDSQRIQYLIKQFFKIENVVYNYSKLSSVYEKYLFGVIRLSQAFKNSNPLEIDFVDRNKLLKVILRNRLLYSIISGLVGILERPFLFLLQNKLLSKISNRMSQMLFGEKGATHIILLVKKRNGIRKSG